MIATVLVGAAALIVVATVIVVLAPEPGFVPKDWTP